MAQNLQLNPLKRDYVLSASGSSIPSNRVLEASYIAMTIPQGQWLYGDPAQGSQLFNLDNAKRTASVEQQISGYVSDALIRQLITTGQASAQSFQNIEATRTSTSNQVTVTAAAVDTSNHFIFTAV